MQENSKIEITKLQKSYIIGKTMNSRLGGVACHAYLEINGENIDAIRLEKAWNLVINNHLMTQAKIDNDGKVTLCKEKKPRSFRVFDISQKDLSTIEKILMDCRQNISHRKMMIDRGQGLELFLFVLPDNKNRICFDIDLTLCDVYGIQELLNELADTYMRGKIKTKYIWKYRSSPNIIEINNRCPVEVISTFGSNAEELSSCNYHSLNFMIDQIGIKQLRLYFEKENRDLFVGMLDLLLQSKNRSSLSTNFIVNIPCFLPSEKNEDFVRDNTKIIWLIGKYSVEFHNKLYEIIQDKVASDKEEWYIPNNGVIPVVYSFNQNGVFLNNTFRKCFGNLGYMISQTPNVCLDVQLFKMMDGLLINFVYPEQMNGFV